MISYPRLSIKYNQILLTAPWVTVNLPPVLKLTSLRNMPRGARCPFNLVSQEQEDQDEKDKIISFKQPIDPGDFDGIKLIHNARVL